MATKIPKEYRQIFIGLLTHQQKQAGYFVTQDEDFIYLFHRNSGNPRVVGIFLYDNATVKEIRDWAEQDKAKLPAQFMEGMKIRE